MRQRVSAGFAVGREADRAGQNDAAFEAYAWTNRLLQRDRVANGYVYDRDAQRDSVDWLIDKICPDLFAWTQGIGAPATVPVYVRGTTMLMNHLVEQIASDHGQVFGTG